MKVKIIGFKVGVSRPTFNKTLEYNKWLDKTSNKLKGMDILFGDQDIIGLCVIKALQVSDFLSIRKVD
jgi:hypothetical protein